MSNALAQDILGWTKKGRSDTLNPIHVRQGEFSGRFSEQTPQDFELRMDSPSGCYEHVVENLADNRRLICHKSRFQTVKLYEPSMGQSGSGY